MTDYERSKRKVVQAEEAATEIERRKADELLGAVPKNPEKGGRPPKSEVPREDIAGAVGESRRTLDRAQQHVAAVEELGEPPTLPQRTAVLAEDVSIDTVLPPSSQAHVNSPL